MPETVLEARMMAQILERECPNIKGIEINTSCPNISHDQNIEHVVDLVNTAKSRTKHPILLKLGYADPYKEICKELDGIVDAFDVINTVPWDRVFPHVQSPLARYNLNGGVSGLPITWHARKVLMDLAEMNLRTPVISGGGIYSLEEVYVRESLGAKAFSIGTLFLRNPLLPNKIVARYRGEK